MTKQAMTKRNLVAKFNSSLGMTNPKYNLLKLMN